MESDEHGRSKYKKLKFRVGRSEEQDLKAQCVVWVPGNVKE